MGILDRIKKNKEEPNKSKAPAKDPAKKSESETVSEAEVFEAKVDDSGLASKVLVRPIVSEKSSKLEQAGQYCFEVSTRSTRRQVARAIEAVYGVHPVKVNMMNVLGKEKRRGRIAGRTKKWRKAIVILPAGKALKIFTSEQKKEK